MDVIGFLKSTVLGSGLNEEQLGTIAEIAQVVEFARDKIIFEEESHGRELFVVVEGRVEVDAYVPSKQENMIQLFTVRPGNMFGEFSLIDGSPRSATAKAIDDVTALRISHSELNEILERDTEIGFKVMKNLAKLLTSRIRNTNLELRNALIWGE